MNEWWKREFRQILQGERELRRISRREHDAEVEQAMVTLVNEAARLAEEHGPGSEAAQRYRLMNFMLWFGQRVHDHRRKPRPWFPRSAARDPSIQIRYALTAAEILDAPPPDGKDSGRGRIFLRIGLGNASWIGSFETGHMSVGSVSMMPDEKHLFVSAKGAGYIIELKSRRLVEQIGTDVAGVTTDESRTLFVVDHNGMSLEAFGKSGRLWKTDTISCGGFRGMSLEDDRIAGEARQASGWVAFSVRLATGEVRYGEGS